MTGTLGLFSLVDLFQLLAASSRTGRLAIDHPRGAARVYFDGGRVVHAEFAERQGEEAVYALFADEQGSFEFTLGLPAPQVTVQGGTENLVLEAVRRLDETRRDRTDPMDPGAVPVFAEDIGEGGDLSLRADDVRILRHVDGRRSVLEIAEASGLELERAEIALRRLLRAGALRLAGRRPRTARLVARLGRTLDVGEAGIDPNILGAWAKALGRSPERVACKLPDGRVISLKASSVEAAGPFILLARDTLLRVDLAADEALLVKPLVDSAV